MTKKRFKFIGDSNIEHIMENELLLPIYDNDKQLTLKENYDLLNELNNKNERLKFENETLKSNYQREIQSSIDFCNTYSKTNGELLDKIDKLEEKNKQLKKENEWLKSIYFANDVLKENEQLKKSVKRQQSSNEECSKYIEELAKENEQLYELIDFANTLFAFKTSESCQKEWEERLKELEE